MENKLTIGGIINGSIQITLKNIASILGAVILWVLTCWIPYINVGTTIAIITMPIELSKGNIMSPTAIFDPKYRKYMGEFFILAGLMSIAISVASAFLFIPGIVISIAWSMAFYLLLDKGMNPMEAINKSNEMTYGSKWTIFLGKLVLGLIPAIIMGIGSAIGGIVGTIISLIGAIVFMPMIISADAVIYKTLCKDGNEASSDVE